MNRLTGLAAIALAIVAVPVAAQQGLVTAATPADTAAAGTFVDNLAARAFAVLRESGTKTEVRAKFRAMLRENFAVTKAGDRLIRRYRNQITPAQLAAYEAALPEYIINIYADRLYDYSTAEVKTVRVAPHGDAGAADVYSRVTVPGKKPLDVIWLVERPAPGKFLVANVTVSGVNLSLTQEADFSSYIQKNGFDALVSFMKTANARPAA